MTTNAQNMRNIALLARQASASKSPSISVNTTIAADACVEFEQALVRIDELTIAANTRYQEGLAEARDQARDEIETLRNELADANASIASLTTITPTSPHLDAIPQRDQPSAN